MQSRSHAPYRTFVPVFLVGATLAGVLFMVPTQPVESHANSQELVAEGNEDSVHRITLKNMVVDDLLDGVITWPEAWDRFYEITVSHPQGMINLQAYDPSATTIRQAVARSLMRFVTSRTEQAPERYGPVLRILLETAKEDLGMA